MIDPFYFMEKENFVPLTYPEVRPNSYLISDRGNVFSLLSNRLKSIHYDGDGYPVTMLVRPLDSDKGPKPFRIHMLVAHEFITKYSDDQTVVNHKNGIKITNYYRNLEYTTPRENTLHAIQLGLVNNKGENSPNNVHSESTVEEICNYFSQGLNVLEVSKIFDCSRRHNSPVYHLMRDLYRRRNWKHITDKYIY